MTSYEDLVGIGNLALLELIPSFDPARGTFAAFVSSRIKCRILDRVRSDTHSRAAARANALAGQDLITDALADEPLPDRPTTQEEDQASVSEVLAGQAAALAVSLIGRAPEAEDGDSPEKLLEKAQEAESIRKIVKALPNRERDLVERFYWGGEPFEAIARDLGISKSRASRLHKGAMIKVGAALQAASVA